MEYLHIMNVLVAYFEEKSKYLKSSTLWSVYSMLKSTLNIKENINIEKYTKLIALLKRKHDGYLPKKSKILEMTELEKFINEAPNEDYLMIKTALIFGLCGACRIQELRDIKTEDVIDRGDVIVITISYTKTKKPRTYCVTEVHWIDIIRKYMSLRPNTEIKRFFLFYSKNKCTRQPVGIHSFGSMPSKIATYLKLENPKDYTGHCFRRSSATALSGNGVDLTTLKRLGGWKSSTVAEQYIEDSLGAKINIANKLLPQNNPQPQPSTSTSIPQGSSTSQPSSSFNVSNSSTIHNVQLLQDKDLPNINFSHSHLENCTINFNFQ
ncbi:hypothetical protein RI129_004829 [Pyrocoelia pectoralis]|uniref:Tyr recombinase domain-containing protein n=1 Tax=Pyrocoelia pectoralis TaxID=417401 RepID=A0AAN7VDN6_9COLE